MKLLDVEARMLGRCWRWCEYQGRLRDGEAVAAGSRIRCFRRSARGCQIQPASGWLKVALFILGVTG